MSKTKKLVRTPMPYEEKFKPFKVELSVDDLGKALFLWHAFNHDSMPSEEEISESGDNFPFDSMSAICVSPTRWWLEIDMKLKRMGYNYE